MTELADTSAWSGRAAPRTQTCASAFDTALVDGELATCDMVRLELLYSARNADEFAEIREELAALPTARSARSSGSARCGSTSNSAPRRRPPALGQASRPADRRGGRSGRSRGLHYDEDYDRIAEITGQPTRWLAPKGSLR